MPFQETLAQQAKDQPPNSQKPPLLLMIGFVIIFLGTVFLLAASILSSSTSSSSSIVIFIGPFPIVFGSGAAASWLILLSIVLTISSVAVFYFMRKETRTGDYPVFSSLP